METFLVILVFTIIFFLWYKTSSEKENFDLDDLLVKSYHQKQHYPKKVVLIIESYDNVESLLTLIRNVLNQNIKVDSIILISQDDNIKKVKLIHDTCIINQVGGLSFLLKEKCDETILIYIFSDGFHAFSKPYFLSKFLNNEKGIDIVDGVVKVKSNFVNINIDKVYKNLQI